MMAKKTEHPPSFLCSSQTNELRGTPPVEPNADIKRTPETDVVKSLCLDINLNPKDAHLLKQVRNTIENHRYYSETPKDRESLRGEYLKLARKIGRAGLQITEYGGSGLTNLQSLLVIIEAFRYDASFGTFFIVHNGLAMPSIAVAANEEQKARFLKPMSSYEKIGAFALTEPEHGSDATSLDTKAKKVSGGWLLNGKKKWIGNGTWADYVVVWARNELTNGIAAYVVEKKFLGFQASLMENKISIQNVENAHITLKNCFVPDSNKLPNEGFGGGTAKVLESSRAGVAAGCVGLLLGAYEKALDYCLKRVQFGKPLAANQLVQEKLMRVLGMLQGAYLQITHLGYLMDNNKSNMSVVALAKAHCSRIAREGVALCREVMGGNGILLEYGVAGPFVDAEALYTYEGTYEVNILLAGRGFTRHNAIYSKY